MSHANGRAAGPSDGTERWRPFRRTRPDARRALLGWTLLTTLLLVNAAHAQSFDQNRYYQQCLRFEAGGNFETARQSCLNALQVAPDFVDADLALARIELKLGDLSSAEARLQRIRNRTDSAEPLVLLAEAALDGDRLADAEALLFEARKRLEAKPNRDLTGTLSLYEGEVAQRRGRTLEAGEAFQRAVNADGLNVTYRLADARLRFLLGDLAGAKDQLDAYTQLSGDNTNAEVRSLLGQVLWAGSDLSGAASEIETALALRSSRQTDEQASDLRNLAVIYYAQGNVQAGGLALREAARRGNLQSFLFSNMLLWVVLFLLLIATHLVAESRIPNTSTLEVIEGPQNWSVGQVYGVLIASILIAALATLVYSQFIYANVLAALTPIQASNVRAVFLVVLTLMLVGLSWRRVARNGWDPLERLVGNGEQAILGIGIGIVLLGATLAYLQYAPTGGILGGGYVLNLTRLTPWVVAAIVVLPLTELFFRSFLIPSLRRRYDPTTAGFASAGVYALALVTPIPLLFVIGLVLTEVFRRRRNGLTPLIAQMVVGIGLVLLVAFADWPRSLFMH